ncbi:MULTISPECIES: flavodoxin family protein [unclassified Rhizobacter]|uniref:flavodoxin family protein n=1 Tax=unclassified Rhizobacter TaxID=2640088 RepID=UPI0006F71837|nr:MULTISPECIES: NAD(P)H-dependent oxidoreductase [unclassified Rhizobacter]KQU77198.1 NAD(P)H dehydrogenase [Rhizobacter sp. Root29]KQW12729.1 NAD(P)H dehydrogenase [Rhizobacter sp. Root1238]KRB22317.1 NAD(P)H dehydrogenase [Rhizobacter sp. Root16D2]
MSHHLFIVASTREPGHVGNTEWLARRAAEGLPAGATQTWLHLAQMPVPPFTDQRHTVGTYPWPEGHLRTLLDATMDCTDLVLVAPVYWYSFPSSLKTYLDHWSAWMRIDGLPFKAEMAKKRLHLVTTSGNRAKAQPMIDSTRLCAEFLAMPMAGVLWGKGGPPDAVQSDAEAVAAAAAFLRSA